jgi:bifunctional non-homologous end joining protein LigD
MRSKSNEPSREDQHVCAPAFLFDLDVTLADSTYNHVLAWREARTAPRSDIECQNSSVWEPKGNPHEGLRIGHLAFRLNGESLKDGWTLVRMHTNGKKVNWLLVQEKDKESVDGARAASFLEKELSSITTHRSMEETAVGAPPTEKPSEGDKALTALMNKYPDVQLATLVDVPPEGDQWLLHEIKFDGYRLLAFLSKGQVRLQTRNGNDWTYKRPSIYASVAKLKANTAVLDMEAVLDSVGISTFRLCDKL